MGYLCVKFGTLRGAASESLLHNAADPVEINYIYRMKLNCRTKLIQKPGFFYLISFLIRPYLYTVVFFSCHFPW